MTGGFIKKIWEWIRTIFRRKATAEPELAPHAPTELEKRLGREILKRQAREVGRPVDTRQGGPNMTKYQPCTCGRWAKRNGKTMNGAHYWCGKCKSGFFMRAR